MKNIEQSDFLSGDIEIGIVFGYGKHRYNIKDTVINYYKNDQIDCKFYPLFIGYPGDIIFYSLENVSYGKIFYWHHESDFGKDITLISNSFDDFIDKLYSKVEKEESAPLTDEELERTNEKRKKVGLPMIDKFRNPIQ